MIAKIRFKSGSSSQTPGLTIDATPVTVFVGPNNSGKSLALRELEKIVARPHQTGLIIDKLEYKSFSQVELDQVLSEHGLITPGLIAEWDFENYGIRPITSIAFKRRGSNNNHTSSNQQAQYAYGAFRDFFTLRLDGKSRLSLLDAKQIGDLQSPIADNDLAHLFLNNSLRAKIRQIVFEALNKYFVLDPTQGGEIHVRLSNTAPADEEEERALTNAAIKFHKAAIPIQETSDGVRAFIGIITTLIAGNPKLLLVDEPEAFLHPALASRLGQEISRSTDASKRVFASTHSAAFLKGCIQSGVPVTIVRLTYKDGVSTTRILQQQELLHLMRNPLLRSAGVLDGLFYEAVVVTEAVGDSAFYQEINERLVSAGDSRGMKNCLFVNAQNKQTVWDIVKPLRQLGIPAVGIVDLDFIKEGVMSALERACVLPMKRQPMSTLTASIRSALDAATPTGNDWKTSGGIALLSGDEARTANTHFDDLESNGIFVVRSGELESWLPNLGLSRTDKSRWLRRMFERMREDPAASDYVSPAAGDVWDFVGRIRQWVDNPNREGIPD
jgi:ABC-type polar amino acid transport system ATPase subunit